MSWISMISQIWGPSCWSGRAHYKKIKKFGAYIYFFILGALRNDLSDLVQGRPVSDELESLIIKKKFEML